MDVARWYEPPSPKSGASFSSSFALATQVERPAGASDGTARSKRAEVARVLVVEDDASIRDALAQLLASEGYAVDTSENGARALDRLRSAAAPDVIVLDLRMPVMDGWQFRAEQRRDPDLASIPVIAI